MDKPLGTMYKELELTYMMLVAKHGPPLESICINPADAERFERMLPKGKSLTSFTVPVYIWNERESLKHLFGDNKPEPGEIILKYHRVPTLEVTKIGAENI
jgi:hypothetical protein